MNQKGVISFVLMYLLIVIIFLFLFVFIVPFTIDFNSQLMAKTSPMFEQAKTDINAIADLNVRNALMGSVNNAEDTITENTDNLSTFFQYGWILVIAIVTIIFFSFTRSNVERGLA